MKAEDEMWVGYGLFSYFIIWPISFFIILKFPEILKTVPYWAFALFLLFFPVLVGNKLYKVLHQELKVPIPGKDD